MTKKFFSIILLIMMISYSCENNITNPKLGYENVICYKKYTEADKWEIFTNNLSGSNPINISNSLSNNGVPKWSPDGKYIAYTNNAGCCIYDLEKNKTRNFPLVTEFKWLPNGKIFGKYRFNNTNEHSYFIINPKNGEKKKIKNNNLGSEIYFYQDSYTLLYVLDSKLYKTNIDNTYNEFIMELSPTKNKFFTIGDFNPIEGKLLLNTISGIEHAILEYDVETKQTNLIVSSEKKIVLLGQRYSKDFSKIIFVELNKNEKSYLSIIENGVKRRLLKLENKEWFDFNPMQFSYNGKYVAFSKNTYLEGFWACWNSDLYVIDIETGKLFYIDGGNKVISPSWNPKF